MNASEESDFGVASRWGMLGGVFALITLTLLVYIPVTRGGYIWDDDDYVTHNMTLRTWEGLRKIWLKPGAVPQYYPLVHTTFWLEYHLWELNPVGYHWVNVALHALSAGLLFPILRRLKVPGAGLAAAIFAVHPVHLESVAWITERKNALCGVFYFSALWSYLRFIPLGGMDTPQSPRKRWFFYAASLFFYLCALLSKTIACVLPAVLLILIWWKRNRLRARDFILLTPMLIMGAALAGVTVWIEKTGVGAEGEEWNFSLAERCLIAGRAVWFYAAKLIWPVSLNFVYPRWILDSTKIRQFVFPVLVPMVLLGLWLLRRRIGKGPLSAVFIFIASLGPALGFVNVYPMRFSFVADHFQYLADVALMTLGAAILTRALDHALEKRRRKLRAGVTFILVAGLSLFNVARGEVFARHEVLWRDALSKNPNSWMALNNLGATLCREERNEEAIPYLRRALELRSNFHMAMNNLGEALFATGQGDEAVAYMKKALEISPDTHAYLLGLGRMLARQNKFDAASKIFLQAIHVNPDFSGAYSYLGLILCQQGQFPKATAYLDKALQVDPDDLAARINLGSALHDLGRDDQALEQYQIILKKHPDLAEVHYNMANVLVALQRTDEAGIHYSEAIRLEPNHADAHRNLGEILERGGKSNEANLHFQEFVRIKTEERRSSKTR